MRLTTLDGRCSLVLARVLPFAGSLLRAIPVRGSFLVTKYAANNPMFNRSDVNRISRNLIFLHYKTDSKSGGYNVHFQGGHCQIRVQLASNAHLELGV